MCPLGMAAVFPKKQGEDGREGKRGGGRERMTENKKMLQCHLWPNLGSYGYSATLIVTGELLDSVKVKGVNFRF